MFHIIEFSLSLFKWVGMQQWTCVPFINLCTCSCVRLFQWCQPHRRAVWLGRLWFGQSGAFGARQHGHSGQWLPSWQRGRQEAGQAPVSPRGLQTLWCGQTPGQEVSTQTQTQTQTQTHMATCLQAWWLHWCSFNKHTWAEEMKTLERHGCAWLNYKSNLTHCINLFFKHYFMNIFLYILKCMNIPVSLLAT